MRCLWIAILLLVSAFAKAQLPDLIPNLEEQPRQITDTLDRAYDNRSIDVPELGDLSEEYSGRDFVYIETADVSGNFVSRFFDRFFGFLKDVFGINLGPFWTEVLTYTIYLILGGFALYLLIRMLTKESPSALLGRKQKNTSQVKIEDTHIEHIDLKALVGDSVAAGNYRSAIRYLYLDLLKDLSAKGIIEWDYQKSNADYYREIKDPALKSRFKKLSYLYDHVWYGEFELSREAFDRARTDFETILIPAA